MTKLTAVTISTGAQSRTWFLNLEVENHKVRVSDDQIRQMLTAWNLPKGTAVTVA